jgi:hypothetical protein
MFLAYVEQCLVPTLRRNGIVVFQSCRLCFKRAFFAAGIESARFRTAQMPIPTSQPEVLLGEARKCNVRHPQYEGSQNADFGRRQRVKP